MSGGAAPSVILYLDLRMSDGSGGIIRGVRTPAIRPATPVDAPVLAETVRQGFETYRRWAPAGWEPPPAQMHLIGIRDRLGRPETWCAVAEAGDVPAGHAAVRPAGTPEEPLEGLAHLWMLFVREPWWGTGLAARLLALATAEAAARGYAAIRLLTPSGHARARAFYEREGFSAQGPPAFEPALGLDLVEYRRGLAG